MRGSVRILVSALSTAVVIAAIGIATLSFENHLLAVESKEFVDNVVPSLAGNWSVTELMARSTPELRSKISQQVLSKIFSSLAFRLGHLVRYEGATGDAGMAYRMDIGAVVSAVYIARAKFERGTALFRLVLRKRDGRWMIHNFHVDIEAS